VISRSLPTYVGWYESTNSKHSCRLSWIVFGHANFQVDVRKKLVNYPIEKLKNSRRNRVSPFDVWDGKLTFISFYLVGVWAVACFFILNGCCAYAVASG
jgi:hypothetical protein